MDKILELAAARIGAPQRELRVAGYRGAGPAWSNGGWVYWQSLYVCKADVNTDGSITLYDWAERWKCLETAEEEHWVIL